MPESTPKKRATRSSRRSVREPSHARSRSRSSRTTDPLGPGGSIEEAGAGTAPNGRLPTVSQLIVRAGIAAWSLVGALVILAAVAYVLRQVDAIFPPVIFAFIIVLLLEPFVAGLVARGIRRGAAVAIVYAALLAAVVGGSSVAIPAMVRQGQQFAQDVPGLLEEGGSIAATTFRRLNQDEIGRRVKRSITEYVNENAGSVTENVSRFARIGLRLANFAVTVVIGLILGIYGLLALPRMSATFNRVVSADRRAQIAPVSARVREVFTGFLRARLIVSAVVGGLATFGLWALGMPFWLILGLIVGITNLIPMIGSFIGGIPIVLVALLTKPPLFVLIVLVVLVVAHAVDGYILSPIVLRETANLHPIVVLVAVLIGGALLGVWGILAAVPVAGAIQVLVLELLRKRRMEMETEAVGESPA